MWASSIEMLIFFVSIMVFHRSDFLILSIVLIVKNLKTTATHYSDYSGEGKG